MTTRLTADLLRDVADAEPDREAYVHGKTRVSYGWLDRAADGFAATLLDRGVRRGDVVCLMLASSITFAACYLGALRIGAITSAINLRLGPVERASILARTVPALTVVGDGAALPAGAPDPGVVVPVGELGTAFAADPPARFPRLSPHDPTCIVWTSGTTGSPKGAVYDHEAQAAISRNVGDLTAPGDRKLLVLPFAHVGYMSRVWDELANRTTIVLAAEPWSAAESLRLVRVEAVTLMTGVPTQWAMLLAHPDIAITDFSGVRVAAVGGSPSSPELIRRIQTTLGCPVLNGYTCTEAGVTTGTAIGDSDTVIATTVGKPRPEVELRLVGADGTEVGVGEVGEVLCRSPAMMRGYWRDPELTASVIDTEGFLHTGDLGELDEEGNLRLVGRAKEMYIRGGYNVYPAEVESVLVEHPSVARAAVVGVPAPVLGETGIAYVVPSPGVGAGELRELEETLRAWCRTRLADYKAPDEVVVVDQLPVTPMLKVDKAELVRAWVARRDGERDREDGGAGRGERS